MGILSGRAFTQHGNESTLKKQIQLHVFMIKYTCMTRDLESW